MLNLKLIPTQFYEAIDTNSMYYCYFQIVFTVVPGLFIGAGISKTIANFLEENELFVPSDDDDDDD